jgi:hypothetical protein
MVRTRDGNSESYAEDKSAFLPFNHLADALGMRPIPGPRDSMIETVRPALRTPFAALFLLVPS